MLTEQWRLKHDRSARRAHTRSTDGSRQGGEPAPLGGKLVGAGGGGFLLFYADDQVRACARRWRARGPAEVTFAIDELGSTVIVQ